VQGPIDNSAVTCIFLQSAHNIHLIGLAELW
jgi:hypothetical protein